MTSGSKILVVDDEFIIAEDLKIKLINMGYSVPAIVSSGEDAITKVKEINPDLILMDIVIHGKMDGIETVEKIHSFSDVPVIYLTAHGDQKTLERAKITGPFGYINKPYNERDLRTNIEIALYKNKMDIELKDTQKRLNEAEKLLHKRQLEESEEKYRELFENAQDAMFVTDIEANFLKMNKIGIEMLGCTKEEVIGTNISRWFTPQSIIIIQERQEKHISGEKANPTDILETVGKNNEHRWVEIRTRVIRSDDGRIKIHGIARDITETRLLKQKLNKSNKQQKLLCHLIQGTRGGKTRALILKHLSDKSYNANQLAIALNMDYKTIKHHLIILIKNGIIGKVNETSSESYYILNNMDFNFDV